MMVGRQKNNKMAGVALWSSYILTCSDGCRLWKCAELIEELNLSFERNHPPYNRLLPLFLNTAEGRGVTKH